MPWFKPEAVGLEAVTPPLALQSHLLKISLDQRVRHFDSAKSCGAIFRRKSLIFCNKEVETKLKEKKTLKAADKQRNLLFNYRLLLLRLSSNSSDFSLPISSNAHSLSLSHAHAHTHYCTHTELNVHQLPSGCSFSLSLSLSLSSWGII